MTPPPWTEVPVLMRQWVDDACRLSEAGVPFPEALASIRNRFERIHPFLDGNGRAGRLLLDNLYRFIVPAVAGPARLVPVAALVSRRSVCTPCAARRQGEVASTEGVGRAVAQFVSVGRAVRRHAISTRLVTACRPEGMMGG